MFKVLHTTHITIFNIKDVTNLTLNKAKTLKGDNLIDMNKQPAKNQDESLFLRIISIYVRSKSPESD